MGSDSPRPSLVGRRLGAYQVQSLLGAGGMGEVYRARDTRLGRDVALKVLPSQFTSDPERLARLNREARALAALNDPHIATIYGLEDAQPSGDGSEPAVRALVLELVEGETLENRIRGAQGCRLPLGDTLEFARQIADALDTAHERGVIHRDLKPANIKVTPDGVVKVLDFGLARLTGNDDAAAPAGTGSTVTALDTREGLVVGTAAYMSPEQARGQAIDKRTDIWAFGCVLYAMLTGRHAFGGATVTDTLAAVLEREPDWSLIPHTTPIAVQGLLRRCLEKNRKQRLRDIADARRDLDASVHGSSPAAIATSPRSTKRWTVAVAAALIAIAGGLGAWTFLRSGDRPPASRVARATVTLPAPQELDMGSGAGPLALSPDGQQIAYVAFSEGHTQLFVRPLDAFDSRPIAGTDGAQYPFFSPDGEWVAFFAGNKLKKVALAGGAPVTLCDVPTLGRGGSWSPDGTIVFDPGDAGLLRVPADGGQPAALTSRDPAIDKGNLSWPVFLPDGRTLIATLNGPSTADAVLAALSLDTGEWHRLGRGSQAQYLPSGHLVYHAVDVREGELNAVPFDREALTLRGAPIAVLDSVQRAQNGGAAYFAVAQDGTLIYTPGGYARTLVSVDRNGRRTPLAEERRGYRHPDFSPDGTKVAVTVDPRPSQIWIYDILRKSWTRLAGEKHSLEPLWAPDNRRVLFDTDGDLFSQPFDASTPAETLLARPRPQYATSWSPDGKILIFSETQADSVNKYDIWALPIGQEPRPLIRTPSDEGDGSLSPNGAWLAYQSDESGRMEIYVRPFPNVDERKWPISTSGGRRPVWSPDGRELFYGLGSAVYRVAIDARSSAFTAGAPEMLFSGPFDLLTTEFTIMPDGSRFLLVENDPNARPTQIQVVFNWEEELKQTRSRNPADDRQFRLGKK